MGTRHNLGFACLEYFRKLNFPGSEFVFHPQYLVEISDGILGEDRVRLVKPQTWMNLSGQALARMQVWFDAGWQLIVVHDDLDIALGNLRIKQGGGSGGHNGLKSIIAAFGHGDFIRLRLGIACSARDDVVAFVLSRFSDSEKELVGTQLEQACQALEKIISSGLSAAMNQFNRRVES